MSPLDCTDSEINALVDDGILPARITDNPRNLLVILDECVCMHASGCLSQHVGYFCTRKLGHSGDHIACGGTQHLVARWPNDGSKA